MTLPPYSLVANRRLSSDSRYCHDFRKFGDCVNEDCPYPNKPLTLAEELADLERTDPAVAAASASYDEAAAQIVAKHLPCGCGCDWVETPSGGRLVIHEEDCTVLRQEYLARAEGDRD